MEVCVHKLFWQYSYKIKKLILLILAFINKCRFDEQKRFLSNWSVYPCRTLAFTDGGWKTTLNTQTAAGTGQRGEPVSVQYDMSLDGDDGPNKEQSWWQGGQTWQAGEESLWPVLKSHGCIMRTDQSQTAVSDRAEPGNLICLSGMQIVQKYMCGRCKHRYSLLLYNQSNLWLDLFYAYLKTYNKSFFP